MLDSSESGHPRTSRWQTALHRLGYIATAIVIVEAIVLGIAIVPGLPKYLGRRAEMIEDSRTHKRPLYSFENPFLDPPDFTNVMLPLNSVYPDGLRFFAAPSFGDLSYAVILRLPRGGTAAQGRFIVVNRANGGVTYANFSAPAADYLEMMREIDRLNDDWSGSVATCLDGTTLIFERVRGVRVTSGKGNCEPHQIQTKQIVLSFIQRFSPGPDVPDGDNWFDIRKAMLSPAADR